MSLQKKDILPLADVGIGAICLTTLCMCLRYHSFVGLGMALVVLGSYLQWRLSPSWSEEWLSKMTPLKWVALALAVLASIVIIVRRSFDK